VPLVVKRLRQTKGATLSRVWLDGLEECYGLEPQAQVGRNEKNWAIPAGQYELGMKELGLCRLDQDYSRRFGSMHQGMIEVLAVPNRFEVLLSIGNSGLDTQGHLLVGLEYFEQPPRGMGIKDSFWLAKSALAYHGLYEALVKKIKSPERCYAYFVDAPAAVIRSAGPDVV
jgi:hypothetical protein